MLPIAVTSDSGKELGLELNKLNRHGLITGATGTGKTVTLKVITEQLSKAGIPVFLADIKGDLASLAQPAVIDDNISGRLEKLNITQYQPQSFPVRLWDVFGEEGTPVRATISEMGPTLLSRLLGLNETQTGILNIVFRIADDQGLLLIDLKDLQRMLQEVGNHATDYTTQYGNITKQSIGAIQRHLLVLEEQGGDIFFGEPAIRLEDFMTLDPQGRGVVNILMAKKLFHSPLLYSTFLIWLLTELFQQLPEVGDPEKPKLVFFFDEAHLLFKDAPKAFVEQVEQVVRLIRSKGVGVYFITQNPIDLPEDVSAQLGNRVQHAIRAYTPKEVKAVKSAGDTFRPNPELDVAATITQLKVGEALISFLNEEGQPEIVERAFVRPPESKMGAVDPLLGPGLIAGNPLEPVYRQAVDRESAYEILGKRLDLELAEREKVTREAELQKELKEQEKERDRLRKEREKEDKARQAARKKNPVAKATDTFVDSMARTVGRELSRSLLGILKKK